MENIEFNPQDNIEETTRGAPVFDPPPKQSAMVGWVMKLSRGTIDETKANYVLLGIAVLFVVLTIITIVSMLGGNKGNTITYKEDVPEEVRAVMPQEIYNSLPSRGN